MEKNIDIRLVIFYFIAINIISLLAMYIDKRKAKKGSRRIPEKNLFYLVFLGGGIGGILRNVCI